MLCRRCKQDKPQEAFSRDTTRVGGYDYWCKACKAQRRRIAGRTPLRAAFAPPLRGVKFCRRCQSEKPINEFGRDGHHVDGLSVNCLNCRNEMAYASRCARLEESRAYQREWHRDHREERNLASAERRRRHPLINKSRKLQERYGIFLREYDHMMAEQDGRCAICQVQMAKMHVDHDHATGQVRALLCAGCNAGLGMFKDNLVVLAAAIAYVERFQAAKEGYRELA